MLGVLSFNWKALKWCETIFGMIPLTMELSKKGKIGQ
jgi:hypothetical protein